MVNQSPTTIDVTPAGLRDPQHVERAQRAARKQSDCDYRCFMLLREMADHPQAFDQLRRLARMDDDAALVELLDDVRDVLDGRRRWSEELARAVCGRESADGALAPPTEGAAPCTS